MLLLFIHAAVADPGNVAITDWPTLLGVLSSSSPGVALAIALAYGAARLSAVATRATLLLEQVAREGIPVRVELAARDHEELAGGARALEVLARLRPGSELGQTAWREASEAMQPRDGREPARAP